MLAARRHFLIAASTLGALLLAGALFALTRGNSNPLDPVPSATTPRQTGRLTPTDAEVLAFFQQNPAKAAKGPGLFETDFFKPPPAPPAPPVAPPPPPPKNRSMSLTADWPNFPEAPASPTWSSGTNSCRLRQATLSPVLGYFPDATLIPPNSPGATTSSRPTSTNVSNFPFQRMRTPSDSPASVALIWPARFFPITTQ